MNRETALKTLGLTFTGDTLFHEPELLDAHGVSHDGLGQALGSQMGFCGCGWPEGALAFVRDVLDAHPLYENQEREREIFAGCGEGIEYFVLYTLDHHGLTDHGGSVGGAWLTPKGEAVLTLLRELPTEEVAG